MVKNKGDDTKSKDKSDKDDKSDKAEKADKADKHDKGAKADKIVENGTADGVNGEKHGDGEEDGEVEEEDDLKDEEREKLHRVLTGELEDLPPLGSKIVRIFTSSTFTGKGHYLCLYS